MDKKRRLNLGIQWMLLCVLGLLASSPQVARAQLVVPILSDIVDCVANSNCEKAINPLCGAGLACDDNGVPQGFDPKSPCPPGFSCDERGVPSSFHPESIAKVLPGGAELIKGSKAVITYGKEQVIATIDGTTGGAVGQTLTVIHKFGGDTIAVLKKANGDIVATAEKAGRDVQWNVNKAWRDVDDQSKRTFDDIVDAGEAIERFRERQLKSDWQALSNASRRLNEGKAVDAMWGLAVEPAQASEKNAAQAAIENQHLNQAGAVLASYYGGPSGAAAYAAWITYRTTGDANLALRQGVITGMASYATGGNAAGASSSATNVTTQNALKEAMKRAALAGAAGGIAVAAQGGDEKDIENAFFKSAGNVLLQYGTQSLGAIDPKITKGIELAQCMENNDMKCITQSSAVRDILSGSAEWAKGAEFADCVTKQDWDCIVKSNYGQQALTSRAKLSDAAEVARCINARDLGCLRNTKTGVQSMQAVGRMADQIQVARCIQNKDASCLNSTELVRNAKEIAQVARDAKTQIECISARDWDCYSKKQIERKPSGMAAVALSVSVDGAPILIDQFSNRSGEAGKWVGESTEAINSRIESERISLSKLPDSQLIALGRSPVDGRHWVLSTTLGSSDRVAEGVPSVVLTQVDGEPPFSFQARYTPAPKRGQSGEGNYVCTGGRTVAISTRRNGATGCISLSERLGDFAPQVIARYDHNPNACAAKVVRVIREDLGRKGISCKPA